MTISTTTSRASYSCNGVATAFSFPYRFLQDADLTVYLVDDSDGSSTTLTLTTHYTVSGAGDAGGGTVTTVSTYASGYTLVIVRDPDMTQETDFVDNDPLPADSVENALDKLTMLTQIMSTRIDRSFRLGDDDTSTASTTLPTPAASKLIGWDSAGTALANYAMADLTATVVSAYAENLLDDTDAATARTTLGLGDSATLDVGTAAGTVAAGDHNHDLDYADIAAEAQVSISGNDTTVGFLNGKLVAGMNITLTENSDGSDETLTIESDALVAGTPLVVNPYATGTASQAHGLGSTPIKVVGYLECLTTEKGYSVGDRVQFDADASVDANSLTVGYNGTNVFAYVGGTPKLWDKNAANNTTITAANWKLVITPYVWG